MLANEAGQAHGQGLELVGLDKDQREKEVIPDRHGIIDGHQRDGGRRDGHDDLAVDTQIAATVDARGLLQFPRNGPHEAGEDEHGGGQAHGDEHQNHRKRVVHQAQAFHNLKQRDDGRLQRQHDTAQKQHAENNAYMSGA